MFLIFQFKNRVMFFQEHLSIFHMGNTSTEAFFYTQASFFFYKENFMVELKNRSRTVLLWSL